MGAGIDRENVHRNKKYKKQKLGEQRSLAWSNVISLVDVPPIPPVGIVEAIIHVVAPYRHVVRPAMPANERQLAGGYCSQPGSGGSAIASGSPSGQKAVVEVCKVVRTWSQMNHQILPIIIGIINSCFTSPPSRLGLRSWICARHG